MRIMEGLKHLLRPDHLSFLLASVTLALRLWIPSIILCSFTFTYDLLEEKIGFFGSLKMNIMKRLKHLLLPDHLAGLLLLVTLALQLWIPSIILYVFIVIYDILDEEIDFLKKMKTSV